ncbi:hypothetical protein ACEWY4_016183 [Coilia grayii]|uniref:Uncharacterized protein n=1 Tax=Coilia grayii TaxID=363190 RepID=A0ABD1JL09_9TELE
MEETTEPQFEIPELNTLPKRRGKSKKRNSTVLDTETSPEINNNAKRPPLRRGSSFTFLTPSSQWDFSLKRKRREKDDDSVSLSSFDFKQTGATTDRHFFGVNDEGPTVNVTSTSFLESFHQNHLFLPRDTPLFLPQATHSPPYPFLPQGLLGSCEGSV